MDEKFIKKIEEIFARHVEQTIREVDAKLSKKIDAIAADLAAHRDDTERHGVGYHVSESRD
jgi:enoyl-[acyl-carrier-protein] reductase (NADH)